MPHPWLVLQVDLLGLILHNSQALHLPLGSSWFCTIRNMSGYENIVGGKLKLKGKALDVKGGGVKKKKKKHNYEIDSKTENQELTEGGSSGLSTDPTEVLTEAEKVGSEGQAPSVDDHLTPAERRYIEQRERINAIKLAKTSNKSHRDRIQDFNQYLANLSEHYDIPKVGPG